MRNEPWVWPEVGDARTSGAGAVPLRSAQLMGQQKEEKKKEKKRKIFLVQFSSRWYLCAQKSP